MKSMWQIGWSLTLLQGLYFLLNFSSTESFTIAFSVSQHSPNSLQPRTSDRYKCLEAHVEAWDTLEKIHPSEDKVTPSLVLYRDTNGWCPFCERVWLYLLEKGIPFEEELINLQNKPAWYKEIVPTNLVPAIKYLDNDEVVWESLDVISSLEEKFPDNPLLPTKEDPRHNHAAKLIEHCSTFLNSSISFVYNRDPSTYDEKKGKFIESMSELNVILSQQGGPFFLGEHFSVVDAVYVPFLERYSIQIPVTSGIKIRDNPEWPHLSAWYQAMDTVPSYSSRVKGDEYSWTAVTSMFMKIFSNGTLDDSAVERAAKADNAVTEILNKFVDLDSNKERVSNDCEEQKLARIQAATKILGNREAIIADATNAEPKSQNNLLRCKSAQAVDLLLRSTVTLLLNDKSNFGAQLEEMTTQLAATSEAQMVADSARYISARICAPRDMGAEAATELRMILKKIEAGIVAKTQNPVPGDN